MSDILFSDLDLAPALLSAVEALGYQHPSSIQAAVIPRVMQGADVIGQAQTGTGKTAAFALPLLNRLVDEKAGLPRVLVLTPTRELALQVTEAFGSYAKNCRGLRVTSLCGGMDYRTQIKALKDGVQVVVGTPGRVIDHMQRGTLKLSELYALVLDEADEMLRMGFIDDVEAVLAALPDSAQRLLFSATMPKPIRRLAQTHLRNPEEITIEAKTATVASIRQRYLFVPQHDKREALLRILDTEDHDGVLIFVRTKDSTLELADFIQQAGHKAAALNGDLDQKAREMVVEQFKKQQIDLLVATDVVARGLDVPRVSLVVNYDIPLDAETYVHRIGRTGRAGRDGDAILFVTPRDKRLLHNIEHTTRQQVTEMAWPSAEAVNALRRERFVKRILARTEGNLEPFQSILGELEATQKVNMLEVAAAIAVMLQGRTPFYVEDRPRRAPTERADSEHRKPRHDRSAERKTGAERKEREVRPRKDSAPDAGMRRYRVEVGKNQNVKPGNLVGAIANEIGISSQQIGRIELHPHFSTVDLPDDLSTKQLNHLKTVWVGGKQLDISPDQGPGKQAGHRKSVAKGPRKPR